MMNYEQLELWKVSTQLANFIYELTEKFPKKEQFRLVDQMCRAAVSVPSNFAEGVGRQYKKETKHFLYISRGSLFELETQSYISLLRNYITNAEFKEATRRIDHCRKLLHGYLNYLKTSNLR